MVGTRSCGETEIRPTLEPASRADFNSGNRTRSINMHVFLVILKVIQRMPGQEPIF
ncbi:hypothetical protein SAMN06265374_1722 [Roseibium denhamense]|uniref:Uncharacterized protein n=1 Tax=Roseibium denhamense TaxID=76305 RepID=A0ABY1NS70_9HYPH|nr:hypothetical protein SAMN06265374_1722 [Roseibium denhamense]